jgi:hypothetical protein
MNAVGVFGARRAASAPRRAGSANPHGRARGGVLVVALVMLAAGMTVAFAVAASATLELAMAERTGARLRAVEAAEAGIATTLRAGAWSAATPWTASGDLPEGGRWNARVALVASRFDPLGGPVEWLFEITSLGEAGSARAELAQGFRVLGPLPGVPELTHWRQLDPPP